MSSPILTLERKGKPHIIKVNLDGNTASSYSAAFSSSSFLPGIIRRLESLGLLSRAHRILWFLVRIEILRTVSGGCYATCLSKIFWVFANNKCIVRKSSQ